MTQNKKEPAVVALIPARSGSKRVAHKNIKRLGGHPMIAYTIASAIQSAVFDDVIVSTDSEEYAAMAEYYGASVPVLRPKTLSGDLSPDIEWVTHMMTRLKSRGKHYDCFSILRPTSPFRKPETIRRAWQLFMNDQRADSLRAVEKCSQHPGKMWVMSKNRMVPLLPFSNGSTPWHSSQYQSLPEIYVQNASLEIAWTRVPEETGTIAGESVMPFFTEGCEGFDINSNDDIAHAEEIVRMQPGKLPEIAFHPYPEKTK
jgi:N-acylneuraminate cytidylyltransferase